MRASPSESSCGGGGRSVRGGATGSTARPSPHPCPPRCSGPTGRPLHDPGCVMQSRVSAMNLFAPLFLQPHSHTLCPFFSLPHFPYFYVDQVTLRPRGRLEPPTLEREPRPWAEGPAVAPLTSTVEDSPTYKKAKYERNVHARGIDVFSLLSFFYDQRFY